MARITWANPGQKRWETGADRAVLYKPAGDGTYPMGYAWPGLTAVNESPTGGESNKQYADNSVYVNIRSVEEFQATIEALFYPDEFEEHDGTREVYPGVYVGAQGRKPFGFTYRTLIGDDQVGIDKGYKIHLVYGCTAAPSERSRATMNDSPEANGFSWELETSPIELGTVNGQILRPTAKLTIDSTQVSAAGLLALENALYGTAGTDPRLPLPSEVFGFFASGQPTLVDLNLSANQPTYNSSTWVVTLPAVTGVQWQVNGVNKAPGAQPALAAGQTAVVVARPTSGYALTADSDEDFVFKRP